jgi:NADH-quinone oxidoreductase subunit C
MLLDLTCVDFPDRSERFEMVYHFLALDGCRRLRVKAVLPSASPSIGSLAGLWKNADWLEREVYDMFGVGFTGHPNLTRLFMYDGFEGHPLRKDYPLRRRQPRLAMRSEP